MEALASPPPPDTISTCNSFPATQLSKSSTAVLIALESVFIVSKTPSIVVSKVFVASTSVSIVPRAVFVAPTKVSRPSTFRFTESVDTLILAVFVAIVSRTALSTDESATICSAEEFTTMGL